MKKVIILSKSTDLHIHPVIEQIKILGAYPILIDLEKNGTEFSISINKDDVFIFDNMDATINLRDVFSVWYRRPKFKSGGEKVSVQWQKDFAEGEERETWDGLWLALKENVFFLNHPFCNRIAGNKIFQLNLAKKIGLQIPNFVVTNKPTDAKNFVEKYKKDWDFDED